MSANTHQTPTRHEMLFVLLFASVTALTCLDQHGNAVDHWVALKHSNDFNYTIYNNVTGAFDVSARTVLRRAPEQSRSPQRHAAQIETYFVSHGGYLSNTLQSLYKAASTSSYLFINDETPGMVSKDEAHQKVGRATRAKILSMVIVLFWFGCLLFRFLFLLFFSRKRPSSALARRPVFG